MDRGALVAPGELDKDLPRACSIIPGPLVRSFQQKYLATGQEDSKKEMAADPNDLRERVLNPQYLIQNGREPSKLSASCIFEEIIDLNKEPSRRPGWL